MSVLKLEAINILNFKSFKGQHTISAFDSHFTAIVGPNGSGKSNIIDSILFVLGFKARKMRHASLKDLITTDCTECRVELVFNTFTISRSLRCRSDKNVTSVYEIDDKEILAGECMEFLKSKGIDLDNNRFLILQGEIEGIAMMNPLELLEYIEDCIGSSSFKPRIESLETEMRQSLEDMDLMENNLKFVETDYQFKKGRRDEKVSLLMFKNKSLVMKNKIVLVKHLLATRRQTTLNRERESFSEKLQILIKRNETASKEIKKLERELLKLDIESKEERLTRYRNEYSRIERENKSKEGRRKRLEKNLEKIKREIEDNRQLIKGWEKESSILRNNFEQNLNEIQSLEDSIKVKNRQLESFEEIREKTDKKGRIEKSILQLVQKKDRYLVEMKTIEALETEIESMRDRLSKIDSKNISTDKNALEKEVSTIKNDINMTTQEINKRKRRAEEFSFLEQCYKREKEVIENLKNVPGVFGFLKDLGSFDKKFEEAIEASTKSMNSIVVDKTSTAEACIDIINKKRLNRTTFIILERLPEPPSDQSIMDKSPIQKVILYRVIQTEPQFVRCFYHALKDTLCVEDIQEARALAFGKVRRRVVTLDGKLLEKSGIMSGGKVSKKLKSSSELEEILSGMQGLLERKMKELNEIKAMENQRTLKSSYVAKMKDMENEIQSRRGRMNMTEYENIEDQIRNFRDELKTLEGMKLPIKALELRSDIQTANEKVEYLQKINQDIKIRLSSEPSDNLVALQREYDRVERETGHFEIEELPDSAVLNRLEAEFNEVHSVSVKLQEEIKEIRSNMGNDYHEEAECKERLEEINSKLQECQKIVENCILKRNEILREFSQTKSLISQVSESAGIIELDDDISFADEMDEDELKKKSKEMIESFNQNEEDEDDVEVYRTIFSEYDVSKKNYENLRGKFDFLQNKIEKMKNEIEELKTKRVTLFMNGFTEINKNIKEIFNLITFGGNAELELLDYLNPFNDGIILSIMPPKKAWKQVGNLSGGEKTLSSLALIFALHKFKPSALYIMDEIDAALDFKNVSVISQYLKHINSQFIVISLRNDMFEMAKTLVGVYKINDVSKAVTVNIENLLRGC